MKKHSWKQLEDKGRSQVDTYFWTGGCFPCDVLPGIKDFERKCIFQVDELQK